MHIPSRDELRQTLSPKLIYSPFLRLVVFNFWFRLAFFGFALLLIFLCLFLPKIWRVTPLGFLPEIKISGLDMAQAWSLRRSALGSAAAGRYEEAAFAWEAAVGNNPGNPELVRGALFNALRIDRPNPKYLAASLRQSVWLLRLTGTNRTDVELVAELYDKFQLYDVVVRLLTPIQDRLTDREEVLFLKALFHAGQIKQFAERWDRLGDRQAQEPAMQLYHAAHLAGWGPPERAKVGRDLLENALDDPARRVVASRLQLLVSGYRGDVDAYRAALERLDRWQADALADHVRYWQLLAATGHKTVAIALARAYAHPPVTADDAARLAEAYIALGLKDEALLFLQRNTPQFGRSMQIWIVHANLLIEQKRWEDLRGLALQIRQQDGVRDALAGYSYYLEGRAELELQRPPLAESAFQKAGRHAFENRALGLVTANSLLKLGYPSSARDILLPLESDLTKSPEYWQTMVTTAFETQDSTLLLTAATKAYELKPESIAHANNYAAALLVNRARAEEAVKLTLLLVNRFPNSSAAKFNHALALLLNQRTDEADALLSGVDVGGLTPRERSSFHLARFEICLNRKEYDKAREVSERIDVKHLFSSQAKWLEEARQQLAARPTTR